jgi:hypothetical protein
MLQTVKQFSTFYGACRFNTLLETQIIVPHPEAHMDPLPLHISPPKFLNRYDIGEISHLGRKPTARKNFDIRSLNGWWVAYTMYHATCIKRFLRILATDLQKNKIRYVMTGEMWQFCTNLLKGNIYNTPCSIDMFRALNFSSALARTSYRI